MVMKWAKTRPKSNLIILLSFEEQKMFYKAWMTQSNKELKEC